MQNLFIIVLIALILSACGSDEKVNCKKFRSGKFIAHSTATERIILERNDSFQTETNNLTGHVIKARIKWINDCEYELSNSLVAENQADTLKPLWEGTVITTKILETKNDYCVYESHMAGVSLRIIDTLFLLRE